MNKYAEVVVLVEGPTEQRFVKQVLGPYMADRCVYMIPIILSKPGQKGGDVKFARARKDIEKHLKQRRDTWITLLVDYYGIRGDWPGYEASNLQTDHKRKAQIMYDDTFRELQHLFPDLNSTTRFIPYVSMYETEGLYFSDPARLAEVLGVSQTKVDEILSECGEPEKINDHPQTAPSKRLATLSDRFRKTSTGIMIASEIGIPKMRTACPLFDAWLSRLESLVRRDHGQT